MKIKIDWKKLWNNFNGWVRYNEPSLADERRKIMALVEAQLAPAKEKAVTKKRKRK